MHIYTYSSTIYGVHVHIKNALGNIQGKHLYSNSQEIHFWLVNVFQPLSIIMNKKNVQALCTTVDINALEGIRKNAKDDEEFGENRQNIVLFLEKMYKYHFF